MTESRFYGPPAPRRTYYTHLARNLSIGAAIVLCALAIGVLGYRHFENMGWIDAFANAAMILSGMGPLAPLQTDGGKLFAGCYALFSGLIFIAVIGVAFAPVVLRLLHKFHFEAEQRARAEKR